METVAHFYTRGANLKPKPFLKEERLVFALNDTQLCFYLFLHFFSFFLFLPFPPNLLRMITLQL